MQALTPGRRAWAGAAWGALLAGLLFALVAIGADFGSLGFSGIVVGLAAFLSAAGLAAAGAWLLHRLLRAVPGVYIAAAAGALVFLFLALFSLSLTDPSFDLRFMLLAVVGLGSLLGATSWVLAGGGWRAANRFQRVLLAAGLFLGLAGLAGGGAWLLFPGTPLPSPLNAAALSPARVAPLALPDPSQPGEFSVGTLFYGSGQDRLRPEYGPSVGLVTRPVDGALLVDGWSALRRADWGFGPEALPLNGRVWYPQGAASGEARGPFPLVLIVHGNHIAAEFSDPGYAYLGELFASHGYIAVSVDENFLNISPSADLGGLFGLGEENDARAWLLLEHLRTWREWNATPAHPFYGKVDLGRVALIGHSRGGEAVAAAAVFNRLPYYPDDANLAFDYGFGIRAVAAIAPIDGQYQPATIPLPLADVSYFVLQGVQDMQTNYVGRRMYDRLEFTDQEFHFKSALYFYGGNHGQFNTVWGGKDLTEPGMRLYNTAALMPGEEQRRIAKVYLAAFLEATLQGENGYLPLFRDARCAPTWLPQTIYMLQYSDTDTRPLATFEEDLDLTTLTLEGGSAQGERLATWFERRILTKNFTRLETRAVYLGWEAGASDNPPFYALHLPEGSLPPGGAHTLVFALGDVNESPEPLDLTIEVADRAGNRARLPLSSYAYLQPRLPAGILKAPWMSRMPASELVLQYFEFPLALFAQANPAFDPATLAEVRLVFDRVPWGLVALDEVGLR